jgi:hypothetical protein
MLPSGVGPIQQQLVFTPYHASGTYDVGDNFNGSPGAHTHFAGGPR